MQTQHLNQGAAEGCPRVSISGYYLKNASPREDDQVGGCLLLGSQATGYCGVSENSPPLLNAISPLVTYQFNSIHGNGL